MAENRKILGQLDVPSDSLTNVYTVPSLTESVISTVILTNRSNGGLSFRLSIAENGASDSVKQYIYYNQNIPSSNSFASTIGITMNAGDVMRVYASASGLSINVFGVEIS
jgi:hypothetical protein